MPDHPGLAVTVEPVPCPNCRSRQSTDWAEERGFKVVRCADCTLLYVNPRPTREHIEAAVAGGQQSTAHGTVDVSARRINSKVGRHRRVLASLFSDLWRDGKPVAWIDVGAGYGELVEAVLSLATSGSVVEGLEPMKAKADAARKRGLPVRQDWLRPSRPKADVVSLVDVFSHIPEFDEFLADVRNVLRPGGSLFLETGNLADVASREDFPDELGLPDHLVFAGESQIRSFLERAGFEVIRVDRVRVDGFVDFAKRIVKRLIGRPVTLQLPYRSNYRQLLIRARLGEASDSAR